MCVLTNVIFSNSDEDVKIRAVFNETSLVKISLIKEDNSGSSEYIAVEITITAMRAHIRES